MPARDVLVSAVFKEIVLTQQNRDALSASVGIVDTAAMKAISNLSATEISDTYTNLVAQAEAILEDDDASPDQINFASIELLRMFGIMNRKEIGTKQLSALVDAVSLAVADSSALAAAKSAASGTDAQAAVSAWDGLIDAYYTAPTNTLLESLCASYGALSAADYTEKSFQPFSEALSAAKLVLEKSGASQSEIDVAAAQLSYAGRNLVKLDIGKPAENIDESGSGEGNLKGVLMICAFVLAAVALVLLTVAIIKVISRKKRA